MGLSLTLPDLAGTFILIVLAVLLFQPLNTFINMALPHLDDFSSILIQLTIPLILLAIISNLWENEPPR